MTDVATNKAHEADEADAAKVDEADDADAAKVNEADLADEAADAVEAAGAGAADGTNLTSGCCKNREAHEPIRLLRLTRQ